MPTVTTHALVVRLAGGSTQTHLYNVLFGVRVGRGRGWTTHRFVAY